MVARCYEIKEEEEKEKRSEAKRSKAKQSEAKRRRKVRLMPYFSIITTAVASLTMLPVFDGIKVYHAIVSSHYDAPKS